MSIPLREVTSPIMDSFTSKFLKVFAGADGAGGAPHYYAIADRTGRQVAEIHLQHGNPDDVGVNGVGNQTLLLIALDFLFKCNAGEFRCRENSIGITKLEEALLWSKARELDRLSRGVLQKHEK